MPQRCAWPKNELAIRYHDEEWGTPVYDDRVLFEFLVLEGAQAGLSWDTILAKRDRYRQVYRGFNPAAVARFNDADITRLLFDQGIVRNRLKVQASIYNAQAFLQVQLEFGAFHTYIWSFVGGAPKQNHWRSHTDVPAKTPESDAMSKALLKRGFRFVGPTICYAFMQATGMVNDHTIDCFRHPANPAKHHPPAASGGLSRSRLSDRADHP